MGERTAEPAGRSPAVTLGVAGDTMLGRLVAELLIEDQDAPLIDERVAAMAAEADALLLNLECCISDRGEPWPAPGKPFFFRAPPRAAGVLRELGTDVVTLANNHALDFGASALLDTVDHLDAVGIRHVGAGPDVAAARRPVDLDLGGLKVRIIGATDHPADFAAGPDRPGVAFADLRGGESSWIEDAVGTAREDVDVVVVTVHWGPNMVADPVPHVRRAAERLAAAGADLIVGHSAHVIHGVGWHGATAVLFDVGDFLDDYAVDPDLRNDLGAFWLVHLVDGRVDRVEAIPLELEFRFTRAAQGSERRWVDRRLTQACRALGGRVRVDPDRLVITPADSS